ISVAGLRAPVILPRPEEQHGLRSSRFDELPRVRADARATREHTQVQRLEMREHLVGPFDREHGLPRLELVTLVERLNIESAPIVGAELENRDRLVDTAQKARVLTGHLHQHAWRVLIGAQHLAGALEVLVGVEALANLLDRQAKQRGVETLAAARHGGAVAVSAGRGLRRRPAYAL